MLRSDPSNELSGPGRAHAHPYLSDVGHSRGHCAELDIVRLCCVGDDLGQRGFAAAWRAPQYDGREAVPLDHLAEYTALPDHTGLALKLLQCARAHAVCERLSSRQLSSP